MNLKKLATSGAALVANRTSFSRQSSARWYQFSSNSLLEALSQEMPLIGLDVPIANQNYIPHTGYLVPVDKDYSFSVLRQLKIPSLFLMSQMAPISMTSNPMILNSSTITPSNPN